MQQHTDFDVDSINERMREAEKYVRYFARRFACRRLPYEDLAQEIRLAIFLRLDDFDESKSSFGHWASQMARHRAIDTLRRYSDVSRLGYRKEPDAASFNTLGSDVSGEWVPLDPEHKQGWDELSQVDWRDLETFVAQRSRAVQMAFAYYSGKWNQREVAEHFGISESRACQIIHNRSKWLRVLERLLGLPITPKIKYRGDRD